MWGEQRYSICADLSASDGLSLSRAPLAGSAGKLRKYADTTEPRHIAAKAGQRRAAAESTTSRPEFSELQVDVLPIINIMSSNAPWGLPPVQCEPIRAFPSL